MAVARSSLQRADDGKAGAEVFHDLHAAGEPGLSKKKKKKKNSGVETCKDLRDVLKNKQKLKKWTTVGIQGQEFLVQNSDVEVL